MTEISRVPLLDLTRTPPEVLDAMREAFDRVLVSGRYIMGPEIDGLEAENEDFLCVAEAAGDALKEDHSPSDLSQHQLHEFEEFLKLLLPPVETNGPATAAGTGSTAVSSNGGD